MGVRNWLARKLDSTLVDAEQVRAMVADEVKTARLALPAMADYDPHGEGYRPMAGGLGQRNLDAVSQDRMFEIAYFMWDSSPMTRRLARMDKTFLFGEPVTVTSDEDAVQEIIDAFMDDPENNLNVFFPENVLWLGLLGEQCWPVEINPHNGHVTLGYVDPAWIAQVHVNRRNTRQLMRVDLKGDGGRPGRRMPVIRRDNDINSKSFGKLVGECFFFKLNAPPNSPRGRSDFLTLFDWIDSLERYGYNYLERAELMLNFVWDVMIKGYTEEQIREWLRDNPPPQPGAIRAHNEHVEWNAVAPDLKATDMGSGFDMAKSFIMGAAGRPDSWFGAGGKAYQTEADQFGQVPIKDLDDRQREVGRILEHVVKFAIDQAVIHGRLSEEKAAAGFTVNLPEISKKDFSKLINGVPQLTTALTVAEQNQWITRDAATRLFALVAGQFGMTIDPDDMIAAAGTAPDGDIPEDYVD